MRGRGELVAVALFVIGLSAAVALAGSGATDEYGTKGP